MYKVSVVVAVLFSMLFLPFFVGFTAGLFVRQYVLARAWYARRRGNSAEYAKEVFLALLRRETVQNKARILGGVWHALLAEECGKLATGGLLTPVADRRVAQAMVDSFDTGLKSN